jgi:hypothetical protein
MLKFSNNLSCGKGAACTEIARISTNSVASVFIGFAS